MRKLVPPNYLNILTVYTTPYGHTIKDVDPTKLLEVLESLENQINEADRLAIYAVVYDSFKRYIRLFKENVVSLKKHEEKMEQ